MKTFLYRLWFKAKWWWNDTACRYMPRIPSRRPKMPDNVCTCGKPFTKIVALDTGDGWVMIWECENGCGEGDYIDGWFPFIFNWASTKDLERIGIEAV